MSHVIVVESRPGPHPGDKPRHRWACSCSPAALGHWTTNESRARGGGTKHVTHALTHPAVMPPTAEISVEEHW